MAYDNETGQSLSVFFFSSRRRHTRCGRDWSSDVCSSDLDMVTSILQCDRPVICRVNGMRVGGGQEIGMACDFSIASDLALFSQAGPKHGSAPDGGSTDFLPLFVGIEQSMISATLCQPWSAHRFYWLGGLTQIVPALRVDGH